ncbi:MAG: hypothetical protein GX592_05545 [Clostridiales bacterium]|nr:hypothetical protein [Clostridiales bacterium]
MKSIFNRSPLIPAPYAPLSLGSIRPEGWLGAQLEGLRASLSGREEQLFSGEGGWERELYAFDAISSIGWTLDDDMLKARAGEYADGLIASQGEEGWFGPANNRDYWPRILALRALRHHFEATADRNVLKFMDAFFKYQFRTLATHPLNDRAVARGGENMLVALWLYNLTGQAYLLELCRRLREQTLDWPNYFHTFPNTQSMGRTLRWARLKEALHEERNEPLEGDRRPYFRTQYHLTNAENIAMGLKTPGVINLFKSGFKEVGGFRFGWEKLMKYHGVAYGMFTGDDHLSGANPVQGTSLPAVAEMLNTLETLFSMGDLGKEIPDLLEKIAFNALPAAYSEDMRSVQRVLQANQALVSEDERGFYSAGADATLFLEALGFEAVRTLPAWPKFVQHLWAATQDGGLAALSYAPCLVRTRASGVPVKLRVATDYPFSDSVAIELSLKRPAEFPLYLRIPAWVRQPMIYLPDGEIMQVRAGETACVRRRWQTGDVVRLELNSTPRVVRGWYHQSAAVELGPLVMAFAPEPREGEGGRIDTAEEWGWALVRDEPMKAVREKGVERPFKRGEPPVKVLAKAVPIDWHLSGANSAPIPILPKLDARETYTVELAPFGWTDLRISQFPIGELRQDKV